MVVTWATVYQKPDTLVIMTSLLHAIIIHSSINIKVNNMPRKQAVLNSIMLADTSDKPLPSFWGKGLFCKQQRLDFLAFLPRVLQHYVPSSDLLSWLYTQLILMKLDTQEQINTNHKIFWGNSCSSVICTQLNACEPVDRGVLRRCVAWSLNRARDRSKDGANT